MSIEQLINELKDIHQESNEELEQLHRDKVNQDSYMIGYECGRKFLCEYLLEILKVS